MGPPLHTAHAYSMRGRMSAVYILFIASERMVPLRRRRIPIIRGQEEAPARLNLPAPTMRISAIRRRWQHMEEVPLTSVTQACKPRILFGQNNAHLTIAREVHEGPLNSPVATKTKLGWVIHDDNGAVQGRIDGDIVCFIQ